MFGHFSFQSVTYDTEKELEDAITESTADDICFAVAFQDWSVKDKIFDAAVRYATIVLPSTNTPAYNPLQKAPIDLAWQQWKTSGALPIYSILAQAVMEEVKTDSPKIDLTFTPYKSEPFVNLPQQVSSQLVLVFPLYLMFSFLLPLFYMTSKLAEEKESRAREGMKMMGLSDSTYFLSWFIFHITIIFIQSILVSGVTSFNVFPNSNPVLLFLFCFLYGLCIFAFVMNVVAIIPTQGSAATAGTLLWVITFFLSFIVSGSKVSEVTKIIASIIPNITLAASMNNLFYLELQAGGLNFSTASLEYQNYSFSTGLIMLAVFFVVFMILGIYLDQVVPSKNGVAKPWNFCCKGKKSQEVDDEQRTTLLAAADNKGDPRNFENIPEILKRQEDSGECLQVRGLVKHFGPKKAVQGVDLTMYNGQIFALLGHNGAGKTTTISMMTGMIPATSGQAAIGNLDILKNQAEFRKQLGVCPQHDVLFEYLTPTEHLRLFSAFKGTPKEQIEGQVNKILVDIDLVDQANQVAKTLSGGQKRKLSVAIALVGDSKVVMLDEPTSGMDTTARRKLWDMLKEYKNDRIIILTTHYMDEADILGDRIAIMSDGRVKCNGTSLFLKARFGVGYNLVMAKVSKDPAPQIEEFVREIIPSVTKLSEVSQELTFQLPTDTAPKFKEFFTKLEENMEKLGIQSYGIGFTTLEEVFLKIEEHEDEGEHRQSFRESIRDKHLGSIQNEDEENQEEYSIANQSETSFWDQFSALLKKKFLIQIRDPKSLLIQELFPSIFLIMGMYLASIKFFYAGESRLMGPALYPNPKLIFNEHLLEGNGSPTAFTTSLKEAYPEFQVLAPFDNTNVKEYQKGLNLNNNIQAFQDYIFDNKNKNGGTYGQFFYTELQSDHKSYQVSTIVNNTAQDAVGAYGTFMLQQIVRDFTGDSAIKFQIRDYPLPVSAKFLGIESSSAGFTSAFLFAVSFMMIGYQLIQTIIKEKQNNLRHQIIVSGGNLKAYWLSHYVGDFIFQLLPILVAIVSYLAVGTDLPYGWLLFLLFLTSNAPFVYFFSFLFTNPGQGGIILSLIYVAVGWICAIAVGILQVIPSTMKIAHGLRFVFMIFPIYSLTYGVINITGRNLLSLINGQYGAENAYKPLSVEIALPQVIFLVFDFFFYWGLVILIEKGAFNFLRGKVNCAQTQAAEEKDEDIVEEENKVLNGDKSIPVRVNQLRKVFPPSTKKGEPVVAVDQVSFGLEYGECFALLGVSGAGKTTTFKCLTGEEYPTAGLAGILGNDVSSKEGFEKARKMIGYCPQFDSIFPGMTVKEHLEFYAVVKGIFRSRRVEQVDKWIKEMDLEEYRDIRMDQLSGGNKRKTSVAMAMIGNPPIIFLDEPSTGVDPKARRFMWGIVSKISTLRKKSSVIITTHSMEEAEALCTKMGIMVKGNFKCFGTTSHIKQKYGTGFEIEIKATLNTDESSKMALRQACNKQNSSDKVQQSEAAGIIKTLLEKGQKEDLSSELLQMFNEEFGPVYEKKEAPKIDEVMQWVDSEYVGVEIMAFLGQTFTKVVITEHYGNFFKFSVSRDGQSIGQLFGMMEDVKKHVQIGEYQVSQTSLEQIFNNFAKESESTQAAALGDEAKKRMSEFRRRTTLAMQKKDSMKRVGSMGKNQTGEEDQEE